MSNKNKEEKFEYIEINGVKIPILSILDSETETVSFVDGAEEYLENLNNKIKEDKKMTLVKGPISAVIDENGNFDFKKDKLEYLKEIKNIALIN
ncbi:hypothetical protein [Leptotrichia hofstadii]|uniref:Uncharacterized protein n=1 Tax=Leptotrichia hofstadii F0254 TaxID=634994 RepID=C9MW69_9FUSO|nr:hypothetical protein [Leptotrichia hofstadii]EEX74735.1 hypothetical protein GCWU000323_00790 [Leptotrichia hofstadii F0254]